MNAPRVLILGAGPGGLSAALSLQRAGMEVDVVEKAPFVGGLTRTVVRDGFRFDLGGHRFFTKNRSVFDFVEGLLGADLLSVPRLSRIHFRGRFVDYPIRPVNALLNVGPVTTARILKDLLLISLRRRKPGAAGSLEEWMTASFGRTLYETYFKVYAEKVWGIRADRIHADLAAQRVKGLGLADTIRNALFRRSTRARESMVERFHYPRLGYGQICESMAAELTGSRIGLETEPVRVVHDGKRIVAVDVAGQGGPRSSRPEHVISSIPITSLVRLFDPAPPEPVQRAAEGLGFRAVVFAAIFVDLPTVRPESWIYFPAPEISFGRITEPRNWSAAMAPAGKTSVVAEHFCDVGDATWRSSDEEIVRRTVFDLVSTLRLFAESRVLGSCVVRAARAYPRMDVGHKERLAVIESWLDGFANLQVVGRSGMFRYHNTDHVIEAGLGAATNVLGGRVDLKAVNSELTYHESRRIA